jgi:hypothetical protein
MQKIFLSSTCSVAHLYENLWNRRNESLYYCNLFSSASREGKREIFFINNLRNAISCYRIFLLLLLASRQISLASISGGKQCNAEWEVLYRLQDKHRTNNSGIFQFLSSFSYHRCGKAAQHSLAINICVLLLYYLNLIVNAVLCLHIAEFNELLP